MLVPPFQIISYSNYVGESKYLKFDQNHCKPLASHAERRAAVGRSLHANERCCSVWEERERMEVPQEIGGERD
jgi:hypothetical protein